MPGSVFGRALWIRRRSILAWAAGIAAAGALTIAVFPAIRDSDAFQELIARFPPRLLKFLGISPKLFKSAVGFLQAQLYGFIGPTIMVAYAIGIGASATAADEDDGTADLLFAHPVSRTRVMLEQFAALAVLTGALAAMFVLVLVVGNSLADFGVSAAGNLGTNLGLWLLGLYFGTLAMAFGAWRGRRGGAVGFTVAIAVAMFFLNFLAPAIGLRGLDRFTAFHWFFRRKPLISGPNQGMLVLAIGSLVFFAVAVWIFARRDIGALRERPRRRRRDGSAVTAGGRFDFLLDSAFGQSLWRRRKSIWWWTLGLCLLAGLSAGFWPTISKGSEQLEGLLKLVPREIFAAFGVSDPAMVLTPAGFLNSRVYGSLGLVLMLVFAIAMGTTELAGDVRRGTMDVVLSTPVRRAKLVLARWAAMATLVTVAAVCLGLVVALFNGISSLGLPAVGIVAANAGFALLVLFFGTLAMAIGAATGSVAAARGIPAFVAVASFVFNAFGASPAFATLKLISPLHWFLGDEPPLSRGFSPDMLLLAACVVALAGAAVAGFARRDVIAG
jgi:ABC-2 type transport system permease protein